MTFLLTATSHSTDNHLVIGIPADFEISSTKPLFRSLAGFEPEDIYFEKV